MLIAVRLLFYRSDFGVMSSISISDSKYRKIYRMKADLAIYTGDYLNLTSPVESAPLVCAMIQV